MAHHIFIYFLFAFLTAAVFGRSRPGSSKFCYVVEDLQASWKLVCGGSFKRAPRSYNSEIYVNTNRKCWMYRKGSSYRFIKIDFTEARGAKFADPSSSSFGAGSFNLQVGSQLKEFSCAVHCTSSCGTVTRAILKPARGTGSSISQTYECQPGDGACPVEISYSKYPDTNCESKDMDWNSDLLRGHVGTEEECKAKCTEINCPAFIRVHADSKCYFKAVFDKKVPGFASGRDCFAPAAPGISDISWILRADINKGNAGCSDTTQKQFFGMWNEEKCQRACYDSNIEFVFIQTHDNGLCKCFKTCDFARPASAYASNMSKARVYEYVKRCAPPSGCECTAVTHPKKGLISPTCGTHGFSTFPDFCYVTGNCNGMRSSGSVPGTNYAFCNCPRKESALADLLNELLDRLEV